MIFHHNDDVRDCLAVLQEYLEDPRPIGRELAQERLAELAGWIKKELADVIPAADLQDMSDFLHERHTHRSCDWTVAMLNGLIALEGVRIGLQDSGVAGAEVVATLRPAFQEILSQQSQAGAQEHMANLEAMQNARRKGGKASKATDLDGVLRGIVSRYPGAQVKDLWEKLSANSAVFTRPDGSKITAKVEAREPEDKLVICDLATGKELYAGTFKALTGHMTAARKWFKSQEARKIPRK